MNPAQMGGILLVILSEQSESKDLRTDSSVIGNPPIIRIGGLMFI